MDDIEKYREVRDLLKDSLASTLEAFEETYGNTINEETVCLLLTNFMQLGYKKRDGSWHPALNWRFRIRSSDVI